MIRALLWLVIGAGALLVMQRNSLPYDRLTGPHPLAVAPGETGRARDLGVTFHRLETAQTLEWSGPDGAITRRETEGVWLLADVTLTAGAAPTGADALWRGATGRRYHASGRVAGAPGIVPRGAIAPGLPQRGYLAFELPPDEIAGGRLEVAPSAAPMFDRVLVMAPGAGVIVSHAVLRLNKSAVAP